MQKSDIKQVEIDGNLYIQGDCVQASRALIADGSVDLLVTDPPYGISGESLHKHYNRDHSRVLEGYIDVPAEEYAAFSRGWIRQAERVLRPGGQIYIVSGYTHLYEVLAALHRTSLVELNHLIWKYSFGVYTRRKFIASHYHILLYAKPPLRDATFNLCSRYGLEEKDAKGASLNYRDREDVWLLNREYKPGQTKNMNELPLELLIKMLQYSSNEGDLVCDLFLGGFTTAKACVGLNRRFIGCELSRSAFEHQIPVMRKLKMGYLLPELRVPPKDMFTRRGKAWTAEEQASLLRDYRRLRSEGSGRQDSIAILSQKYLRGKWALERMLRRLCG